LNCPGVCADGVKDLLHSGRIGDRSAVEPFRRGDRVGSKQTLDRGVDQVELKDCYIKVEGVSASKEIASASVSFTKDELSIARVYEFVPAMDGGNFIAQAYEHLKTLPEFAALWLHMLGIAGEG
jgi:hypothetical protein